MLTFLFSLCYPMYYTLGLTCRRAKAQIYEKEKQLPDFQEGFWVGVGRALHLELIIHKHNTGVALWFNGHGSHVVLWV